MGSERVHAWGTCEKIGAYGVIRKKVSAIKLSQHPCQGHLGVFPDFPKNEIVAIFLKGGIFEWQKK
jgi:hypothetical protein